ncbi:MAG: hypothetical protein QM784_25595 [Polyangiaceae bacterium]
MNERMRLLALGYLTVGVSCAQSTACSPRSGGVEGEPRMGSQGTVPSVSCGEGRNFGFDQVTPLGDSAKVFVEAYGKPRTAVEVGSHSANVQEGTLRRRLTLQFVGTKGQVSYSDPCARLSIPIALSLQLSTGEKWQSDATLTVAQGTPPELRVVATPSDSQPFYLNITLTNADTDVRIEPKDGSPPVRFTTLCKSPAATLVEADWGATLRELIRSDEEVRLECVISGRPPLVISLPQYELINFGDDVCRANWRAPGEFTVETKIAGGWLEPTLKGTASLDRIGTRPALHYRLFGKLLQGKEFVPLVPCAAGDLATVRLEGGAVRSEYGRGDFERERNTLSVSFTCEDVSVICR